MKTFSFTLHRVSSTAELRKCVLVPEATVLIKKRVNICSQVCWTQEGWEMIIWVESYQKRDGAKVK